MRPRPAPPPRTSRRRHWREVEFAALDFETTGLDLRKDGIVSFGLVPVRSGRIDLAGAHYREVRPEARLSHDSIAVHHLRPVDLAEAPALEDVAPLLRAGLEGRFILAWAAEIEASFLAGAFGGRTRRWLARIIDVLPLAVLADRLEGARLPAPDSSYSLTDVVARAGLPVEDAHNALDDAVMTAELFLMLASRLAPFGVTDVRGLLGASRGRLKPRSGWGLAMSSAS